MGRIDGEAEFVWRVSSVLYPQIAQIALACFEGEKKEEKNGGPYF